MTSDAPNDAVLDLKRDEASRYLAYTYGIDMAPATLAKMACVSTTGPKFFKAGRRALYPVKELDAWAAARLGNLRSSTSSAGPQIIRAALEKGGEQ